MPTVVYAQSKNIFVFEGGSHIPDPGGRLSARYAHLFNDSWSMELGGLYFNTSDELQGNAAGIARLVYTVDFLSIIPSLFVSVLGGWNIPNSKSFMGFDYGLNVDYLYSRKLRFGITLGGQSISGFESEDTVKSSFFFTVGIRITTGDEW